MSVKARDGACTTGAEKPIQAALVRDIFGNPFRPVIFEPSWLARNNEAVLKLARVIYAESTFDRMPELAKALNDAGCHDAEILSHCHEPGNHVRGCWVIDGLLGKS
jgi:hypothetical protein